MGNRQNASKKPKGENGSILVTILIVMFFLSTLLFALMVSSKVNLIRARQRIMLLQSQYAAESAADAAIAYLNSGVAYTGTSGDVTILTSSQYTSKYSVSVANGSSGKEKVITAIGKVFTPSNPSTPAYTRQLRITAQRTSITSSSSVVSRNILFVGTNTDVIAKDIYLNGYIVLDKSNSTLTAENVTVAGKNTGSTNCSIGGSGKLFKPTSFTTPGQTKTALNLAYNNCISPPGNTSNADFDVNANLSSISTVQSMFIPWSQYMDSSYTNAGNCNDWTTGGSPHSIPSTAKASHYPNNSDNVASTCGTSGNIQLSNNHVYTINDHVHLRANLCSSSVCSPIFNNPTADLKFIFLEGTANFDSLRTQSGSGPIVLVVYGADPASKASACPYGGALYLGNGTTSAPALYLITMNGLCVDKSKFNVNPGLGGVSGKNLYIASNSGSPFDLSMNVNFPTSQIPIDLAWRAVRYERQ